MNMHVLSLRKRETTTSLALRPVPTSYVLGYHIYKDVWNPSICYEFSYQREEGNLQDPYAVAIISSFFRISFESW